MSGHVKEHGRDRWRIFVELGRDKANKRVRRTEVVTGTKRAALRRLRELETGVDSGAVVPAAGRTVRDYVEREWMPMKEARLRATTLRGYRVILNRNVLPVIGDMKIQKVASPDIQRVTAGLVEAGHLTQANRVHVLLGMIWRAAVRGRVVGYNVVDAIEAPKAHRREMTALDPSQVHTFLDWLRRRGSWAVVPFTLLFTSGIRRSELTGLRWSDFDAAGGLLHVRRSVHFLPGARMVIEAPKTRRAGRAIALDPGTVAMLGEHRSECERRALMFGRALSADCPMFCPPGELGKGLAARPWRNGTYTRLWWRTCKALGIRARLHDARHTSVSLLLQAGVNVRVVADRHGHSDPSFTLRQYGHTMPGSDVDAARRLADVLALRPAPAPVLPAA